MIVVSLCGALLVTVGAFVQSFQDLRTATALQDAVFDVDPAGYRAAFGKWSVRLAGLRNPDRIGWLTSDEVALLRGANARALGWLLVSVGSTLVTAAVIADAAGPKTRGVLSAMVLFPGALLLVLVLLLIRWLVRRSDPMAPERLRAELLHRGGADAFRLRQATWWDDASSELSRLRRLLGERRNTHSRLIMRRLGVYPRIRWFRCAIVAGVIPATSIIGLAFAAAAGFAHLAGLAVTLTFMTALVVTAQFVGLGWSLSRTVVLSTGSGVAVHLAGGGLFGWRRHRTIEVTELIRPHRELDAPGADQARIRAAEHADMLHLVASLLEWADTTGIYLVGGAPTPRLDAVCAARTHRD